jgi:hypothetical protein
MAPHNASYPELENSLKDANINFKSLANLEERQSYFSQSLLMRVPRQSVSLLPAIDFMKMSLPKKFGESSLFLCP